MQVLHDWEALKSISGPVVLTIGNFDGFHLGHRLMTQALSRLAQTAQAKLALSQKPNTLLVTFEPLPFEYFGQEVARLTDLTRKGELIAEQAVDYLAVLPFRQDLLSLSPEAFLEKLSQHLDLAGIYVGDDFRFGAKRAGDFNTIVEFAKTHGDFLVQQHQTVTDQAGRVSSTRIRQLLAAGKISEANELLAAPFAFTGTVTQGRQLARKLQFPTANVKLAHKVPPLRGVYVCEVEIAGVKHPAVCNIGTRPTVDSGTEVFLESHLLDWSGDLYGRTIRVYPLVKVRDEAKFANIEALQQQIFADIELVKEYFVKQTQAN